MIRAVFILSLALVSCLSGIARAEDVIPYTDRSRPFTGWDATARGDIRTVGMAGATVGLADTFLAAGNNPAGLAMTLDGGDLNFASNNVYDSHIQDYSTSVNSNSYGVALPAYPWGFGLGYFGPYNEGTNYLAGSPLVQTAPSLSVRQFEVSVGRVFFNDQVAFGAGLNFGEAAIQIADLSPGGSATAYHSYAVGANLGAMIQLPRRFLFGLSYSTPMHYPASSTSNPSPVISNFFQPVEVPARSTIALGWIPNRFFRGDFDFEYIGATPSAALIRDQNITAGATGIIVPRLGAAYVFLDYKELQATAFTGTYLETSREQGLSARLHVTGGVEIKPWIATVGWGVDKSAGYFNYLFSLGIDVFKLMAKMDLIPTPYHPLYQGALPNPWHESESGLARPLQKNWKPRGPDMNPIDVISQFPTRLQEKVDQVTGTKPTPAPSPTPTPTPTPKVVPKKRVSARTRFTHPKPKPRYRPRTRPSPVPAQRVKPRTVPKSDDAN
jgi:hypothetical protein